MSSVSFQGIISNLDVASIIKALNTNSQNQIDQLTLRKAEFEVKKQAYNSFSALLIGFQSSANSLNSTLSAPSPSITSSNTDIVTAQATGNPQPGTYNLTVESLATNNQLVSGGFASSSGSVLSAGTFSIEAGIDADDHDVSGTTPLTALLQGAGVTPGSIQITDRKGSVVTLDLSSAKTVQDVLDAISKNTTLSVKAQLNADGTGIDLLDTSGRTVSNFIVQDVNGGTLASQLGLSNGPGGVASTTISGASLDPVYTVTIDPTNDSLDGLAKSINAMGGPFNASVIFDGTPNGYRLSIASTNTGTIGALTTSQTTTVLGAPTLSFSQAQQAKDAKVLFGGSNPVTIWSHTNTLSTLIPGVAVTLNKEDPNTLVSLTAGADTSVYSATLQKFVGSLNALISFSKQQNTYDIAAKSVGGPLFGETTVSSLVSTLQNNFVNPVPGLPSSLNSVFQIGVKVNNDGSFGIDPVKLNQALSTNLSGVQALFSHLESVASKATATASSSTAGFDPTTLTNGVTGSANFGPNAQGWQSAQQATPGTPDYVTLQWAQPQNLATATINTVDSALYPAAQFGIKDFDVQYLRLGTNPAVNANWITASSVAGNQQGQVTMAVGATTTQIRLKITGVNAVDGLARLIQITPNVRVGVADRALTVLNDATSTVSGNVQYAMKGLQTQEDNIDQQIGQIQASLDAQTQQIQHQFNVLEATLSTLKNQANAVQNLITTIAGFSSSTNSNG